MTKSYAIKFSKLQVFLIPLHMKQSMSNGGYSLCGIDSYIRHRFYRQFTISSKVNRKPEDMGFELVEKKGDLFKEPDSTDCLAHCVSVDLRMSKGIAVMFKKLFGGVDQLQRQKVPIGGVGVLERDGRFIYYLVTKEKYFQKPTYASQRSCLVAMRNHCVSHSVRRLAMPRIGCGLDLLQWQQVREDLKDIFKDTDVHITVYSLD